MMRSRFDSTAAATSALLLAVALLSQGCGGSCSSCESVPVAGGTPVMAPDFLLEDVNPNSATHALDITPRAYTGAVSAWYFGTAT